MKQPTFISVALLATTILMLLSPITIKAEDGNSIAQQREWAAKGDSCMKAYDNFHALQYYSKLNDEFINQNASIARNMAELYHLSGRTSAWFDMLQRIDKDSVTYKDLRSMFFASRSNENEMFMYLYGDSILRINPYDSEIALSLASYFNDNGHPDISYTFCRDYLKNDSTNLSILRQYGYASHLLGHAQTAYETYKKLEANGFENYESALIIGVSLIKLDSTWAARDYLYKAVELRTDNEYASLMHLGNVEIACGNYRYGVSYLQQAIDVLKPDNNTMYSLLYSIAEGYYGAQKYEEAAKTFLECAKYKSDKPILYYNIAQMCKGLKDPKKELTYINKFLDKSHLLEDTPDNKKMIADMQERMEYLAKNGVR